MNTDAASLDRLHDLAPPPEVSWWPMAPGWYVVSGILLLVVLLVLYRFWRHWKANAYRRAALRELNSLDDATAIAALLRRTALVIAPRSRIAGKTGTAWLAWLAAQCPDDMPDAVREQLTTATGEVSVVTESEISAIGNIPVRHIIETQNQVETRRETDAGTQIRDRMTGVAVAIFGVEVVLAY